MASNSRSKTILVILLRLLVAGAGVGYVLSSLNFHDGVILKPGYVLPDGSKADGKTSYRVLQGEVNPRGPSKQITIATGSQSLTLPLVETEDEAERRGKANPPDATLHPGIITTLKPAKVSYLALGALVMGVIFPLQVLRWSVLLRARQLDADPWRLFKLIMVGSFFNFCMPGSTGGDVVKAYYAAARSGRRTDAIMSVIFDRIAGLISLIVLAAISGLFILHDPMARRITGIVWLMLLGACLGSSVYFSQRLRRRTGLAWLIQKLPGQALLGKLDAAAMAYRHHKDAIFWAVLYTLPAHIASATSTALAGWALGMDTPLTMMLVVLPVLFLAGALPLTYQGFGVMEYMATQMLTEPFNQIAAMLLLFRIYQMLYSVLGALFLLKGDIHMHPQEQPAAAAAAEPPTVATTS